MAIKVSVVGATGRMGALALEVIDREDRFELHSALSSRSDLSEIIGADVIFDVTKLEVSQRVVNFAIEHNIPVLVGTSGWSAAHVSTIADAVRDHAATVVIVPNFSIGSMLATKFAAEAAKFFESIEIVEAHHQHKVDSPSGTAIRTAELIAGARGDAPVVIGAGQEARGKLVEGIPVHSLRLSGVSAKQDVYLGGQSELLTISHETTSVAAYANGISMALIFTAANPGLHIGLDAIVR
jgi:4-hydroxy-tetrahydrodipicolinate reductase